MDARDVPLPTSNNSCSASVSMMSGLTFLALCVLASRATIVNRPVGCSRTEGSSATLRKVGVEIRAVDQDVPSSSVSLTPEPSSLRPSILTNTSMLDEPTKQTCPLSRRSWTTKGRSKSRRSAPAVARYKGAG